MTARAVLLKPQLEKCHPSRTLLGQPFSPSVKAEVLTLAHKADHDLPHPFLFSPVHPLLTPAPLALSLYVERTRHTPVSGHLRLLPPPYGMLLLQISVCWLPPLTTNCPVSEAFPDHTM